MDLKDFFNYFIQKGWDPDLSYFPDTVNFSWRLSLSRNPYTDGLNQRWYERKKLEDLIEIAKKDYIDKDYYYCVIYGKREEFNKK